jgi:hypothetical protein
VESSITCHLGVSLSGLAFVASQEMPRKRLGDWEAILFVSASTTWTRGGFVPTNTTGQITRQEFASSHPFFTFPHFLLQSCVPLHSNIVS